MRRRLSPTVVRDMARWVGLSAFSFGLTVGITALCHEVIGWSEETGYALALVTAFLANFVAMRHVVFGDRAERLGRQFAAFLTASICFRTLEYWAFLLLHTLLGVHYLLTIIAVQGTSSVIKFAFYRSVVFRKKTVA